MTMDVVVLIIVPSHNVVVVIVIIVVGVVVVIVGSSRRRHPRRSLFHFSSSRDTANQGSRLCTLERCDENDTSDDGVR